MKGTITTGILGEMKSSGAKIAALTAWDAITGTLAEAAGADIILVGDSLAMTVKGDRDTVSVSVKDMLYHTKLVAGVCQKALLVADMPFMSYQVSSERALVNGGRFLKESGARAVKIEGGSRMAATVEKMTGAGVPVMGHIGLTPQAVHQLGGYRVQGRGSEQASALIRDAMDLQNAGVFAIVLECLPAVLAGHITRLLNIPTIGIGAGTDCDGQIQVIADILGITEGRLPKHAKTYFNFREGAREGLEAYIKDVRSASFPTADHSFAAPDELIRAIENDEL